jgi:hypothetical protein
MPADAHVVMGYPEVKVKHPRLLIGGSADYLALIQDSDRLYWETQEFKSKKPGWGWDKMLKEGAPSEDHLGQVITYTYVLRTIGGRVSAVEGTCAEDPGTPEVIIPPLGEQLTSMRITYVRKDDYTPKEFVFDWEERMGKLVEDKIANLEPYLIDTQALPTRLPLDSKGKKSWRCKWNGGSCDYYTKCWDEDPDEIPVTETGGTEW